MLNKEALYKKIINEISITGIEKQFHNLAHLSGPSVPTWLQGQTLYEIYIRAFSKEGTFKALTKKLPQIAALGIKIIWLMPVYPIGLEARKGNLGSSYAIKDYFSVNPEYGSKEDFRELVNSAHEAGLKVVLDMVANHVAPDYNALKQQPNIIQRDGEGNPKRRVAEWTDIVDLDYDCRETREHMLKVLKYWPQNFDIDGYRCDVAGFVPLDFWEQAVTELKKIKKDFFMLAEWESPLFHKKVFHSSYDWSLYFLMEQVNQGKKDAHIIMDWLKLKTATYPKNSLPLRLLENHDLKRAAQVFDGNSFLPYLAFIFSIPGIPLVYNGQEMGCRKYLSHYEKEEIDWAGGDKSLNDFYSRLIHLRREHPALYSKKITNLPVEQDKNVLVYLKEGGAERILVVLNFSSKKIKVELNLNQFLNPKDKRLKPMLAKNGEIELGDEFVLQLKPFFVEYYLVE